MKVKYDMEMHRDMKQFIESVIGVEDWYLDIDLYPKQNRYKYKMILWINKEVYEANNLSRKLTNEPIIEEVLLDIAISHREDLKFKYLDVSGKEIKML